METKFMIKKTQLPNKSQPQQTVTPSSSQTVDPFNTRQSS